jgi:protein-disulfide isomerase
MKKSALFACCLAVCCAAFAQTTTPKKPAPQKPAAQPTPSPAPTPKAPAAAAPDKTPLPSQEQVQTAMQRTLGYDPGLSWQIIDIHHAAIPGVADILISINKQAPQHIYWSENTQTAIAGEAIPFGANPYVSVRAKLLAADGPSRGAKQPVITIVDFSDLECPHCKAAHPILEKLATDFPQVRLVFQQFPLPPSLHPWAMKAAQYADCAGRMDPEAFWKFVGSVFENQGSIALATADDWLNKLATSAGLDAGKVAACAATPESDERVRKSLELGRTLDVNETPTVFINGRMVRGIANIPPAQLKTLVQFEIDHAGK